VDALELRDAKVRNAAIAYFACFNQIGKDALGFCSALVGVGRVYLVKINHVYVELTQTGFEFAMNVFGLEMAFQLAALIPNQPAFGGNDNLVSPARNDLSHHFFRVT
jgi:hypothetical protein